MNTPAKTPESNGRGARGGADEGKPAGGSVGGKPGESGKIKVLVVDDSALIRRGLTVLLSDAADIEVIGAAKDGVEAEEMIRTLRPDVVTLDIEMPRCTGLELLGKLPGIKHRPAVVMVSSSTKSHAPQTVRALELGASDYVFKQADAGANALMQIKDTLIGKVRAVWRHRGSDLFVPVGGSRRIGTRGGLR
ncbi:MAG: response regulator, partial [Planctomycetota bacterium]